MSILSDKAAESMARRLMVEHRGNKAAVKNTMRRWLFKPDFEQIDRVVSKL